MNCSDTVSSDDVLSDENILSSRKAGMGCANISLLLPTMKRDACDSVIIYDPEASFRSMFPDAVIIPPLCEYTGRQK